MEPWIDMFNDVQAVDLMGLSMFVMFINIPSKIIKLAPEAYVLQVVLPQSVCQSSSWLGAPSFATRQPTVEKDSMASLPARQNHKPPKPPSRAPRNHAPRKPRPCGSSSWAMGPEPPPWWPGAQPGGSVDEIMDAYAWCR